ncbi:MAG: FtsX-like permease family protein [Treponema sp.]|nr:FtsX-like permease family protein [Treponema sp.]
MQDINLNTVTLSIKNLQAKPVRTACLILITAILAFTVFCGSIIALNLGQGLAAITKRFGADIMVVPKGSIEEAQTILLRGEPHNFYFDAKIIDTINNIDGIIQASPQFFLASLSTDCCDDHVQLIAYDPETDFVVQPWIAEKYGDKVLDGQVVVGSHISINTNRTIKLFNNNYAAAAQLSPSASGFDTSVFMTMNTMRDLVEHSKMIDSSIAENYKDGMVSAILVKTEHGKDASVIASYIKEQNEEVDALVSQGVFTRIASSLSGFTNYFRVISLILWLLAVVVLAAVFSGLIYERKKEFALLRVIGAARGRLVGIVLCESSLAGIAGGIAGIILACITVFPFANLISARLGLPYLDASILNIIFLMLICLIISALSGIFASLYSALKISKAETYFTMREGE